MNMGVDNPRENLALHVSAGAYLIVGTLADRCCGSRRQARSSTRSMSLSLASASAECGIVALLLDEARDLFANIEVWSTAEPLSYFWFGARRGALILAYAHLCRIGLWRTRSLADLLTKMEIERGLSERTEAPSPGRVGASWIVPGGVEL